MTDDVKYCGQPLSAYSLWDLGKIEQSLLDAEAKRDEASKHKKFKKMDFPSPNPEFIKLKSAIEAEIRNRQNVS